MTFEIRACRSSEELRDALNAIGHYFGLENTLDDVERFAQWMDLQRMHAAFDDGSIVGGAGAFTLRASVPGGSVAAAGVTVVGVLPTHRRRGILTALMRAQLDDCRAHGEAVALLWASEGMIYGRYGYGLASRIGQMSLSKDGTRFAEPFTPEGTVRLVDAEEAARAFAPLYEQVFAERPGMITRSPAWWQTRRLAPSPSAKGGPKQFALLELRGVPAGYAIYTVHQEWGRFGYSSGTLNVVEALATTPPATRELWRWLLDFDWTSKIEMRLLPLDHPLFVLLAEPRRLSFELGDGIWVRLLDVPGAMAGRTFAGPGSVVVELTDAFVPENAGRWRIGDGGAERTDAPAELALDVAVLGSAFLGGFSFADLVHGLRATELVSGAAARADGLFRTAVEPWCPEIF